MARIVIFKQAPDLPVRLFLNVGDMIVFYASGLKLNQKEIVLECLGNYIGSFTDKDGTVIAPAGPPNRSIVKAVAEGCCEVTVIFGDPFFRINPKVLMVSSE